MTTIRESKMALNVIHFNNKYNINGHINGRSNGFILPAPKIKNSNQNKTKKTRFKKKKRKSIRKCIKNAMNLRKSSDITNIVFKAVDSNSISVNVNKYELDNLVDKRYEYWHNITNGIVTNKHNNSNHNNSICNGNNIKLKKYKKRIYNPKIL